MRYDVDADIYQGPLPLLVELTKLNLIDVFLVKLVELTQEYLKQVKAAGVDLNELAEPLPLLGTLVAIKARGLLPQPPAPGEDEEVPISLQELERRLKEYEQFKTVAQLLAELHTLQHRHFTRPEADREALGPEEPATNERPFEVTITDLMGAFAKVLEKASAPVYEVKAEPWTVEMKVQELRVLLTVRHRVRFLELFTPEKSKLELVVTFLALLELMRQRVARAVQERMFDDIMIEVRETAAHAPS
ncbi:MAG: segregation/condensation protein A [Candidatus Omnitrophica bacterium]|nr:segregation/condensation protein A [Candidatus Omnitrophota bacterium]